MKLLQHCHQLLPNPYPRRLAVLLFIVLVAAAATPASAQSTTSADIVWWSMCMKLFGGLAVFLFGMEQMAEALKTIAGERMKVFLARLTNNRFMGAATGAFVTAIIQSSSVTTVLLVGFITAGLMSTAQSIGVIMGANIGTTITAQIVAFKVTKFALLMVAAGFGMLFFSKLEKIKQYGGMLMGLGLIFFGMSIMSDAMHPLRSYEPFLNLMTKMDNPFIGLMVAAGFTALIQSSSATTGIVIVMASQGFISLPAGIALAFGANVGTCVTALLASIGKPVEAVRAALVHVLFNIFGVLLWIGFIDQLAELVTWLSPTHPDLSGTDQLGAETPRQIANAHTIFNISNTFLFIGFTSQFARIVEKLVPDKPLEEITTVEPKYLDEELLETPSLALDRVRLEIGHMGSIVMEMMSDILIAITRRNGEMLDEVARLDEGADLLHGNIITYLAGISQQKLSEKQTTELVNLMSAANDLENMGDIIETDLVYLGNQGIEEGVTISNDTRRVLRELHGLISASAEQSIKAVAENDPTAAQQVIDMKSAINELMESAAMHESRRLVAKEPNRLAAYTLEIDIIEKLKRIYYFAKRISKSVTLDAVSAQAAA